MRYYGMMDLETFLGVKTVSRVIEKSEDSNAGIAQGDVGFVVVH